MPPPIAAPTALTNNVPTMSSSTALRRPRDAPAADSPSSDRYLSLIPKHPQRPGVSRRDGQQSSGCGQALSPVWQEDRAQPVKDHLLVPDLQLRVVGEHGTPEAFKNARPDETGHGYLLLGGE